MRRTYPHAGQNCYVGFGGTTEGTRCSRGGRILVPGGFGERGIEGKIQTVQYARDHGIPYLGICLGMQVAVIEFARNVAGLNGAHSTEFDPATPHPVIALITEWMTCEGTVEGRDARATWAGRCVSAVTHAP